MEKEEKEKLFLNSLISEEDQLEPLPSLMMNLNFFC